LGINSVSTESVNGYELGLQLGLASYRAGFGVIVSDLSRFAGACSVDRWAVVVGCWATWRAGWLGRASGLTGFRPISLGNIENLLFFSKSFIKLKSI
jgi:hypothetical protein